ncbi:hypothetical protein [Streptomyces fuscigenes]|uniref:hypothetical protein n=1 Tax=Streptomyces fuscigenes TaxID=1528880 RepID=UPI001F2AF595|nr:hypothetical protein [Streptomyces fuscigenes]MCF3960310.1 hypothetical protein [Streptomyces fuscigenes]
MSNCTDQNSAGARTGASAADPAKVPGVLAAMADHFTAHDPNGLLAPDATGICASAEVYRATGRSAFGGASALLNAVMDVLPAAAPRSTRAQYAKALRREAVSRGWRAGQ